MNRTLKTLLLLVLMAALPLQGTAAALRVACEAGHPPSLQATGAGNTSTLEAAPATPDDHYPAACCISAAVPSAPASFAPAHIRSEPVTAFLPSLAAGFIPARLERPPKPLSAYA